MKTKYFLFGMLLGIILAGTISIYSINKKWEFDAVNRGYGFWYYPDLKQGLQNKFYWKNDKTCPLFKNYPQVIVPTFKQQQKQQKLIRI